MRNVSYPIRSLPLRAKFANPITTSSIPIDTRTSPKPPNLTLLHHRCRTRMHRLTHPRTLLPAPRITIHLPTLHPQRPPPHHRRSIRHRPTSLLCRWRYPHHRDGDMLSWAWYVVQRDRGIFHVREGSGYAGWADYSTRNLWRDREDF